MARWYAEATMSCTRLYAAAVNSCRRDGVYRVPVSSPPTSASIGCR